MGKLDKTITDAVTVRLHAYIAIEKYEAEVEAYKYDYALESINAEKSRISQLNSFRIGYTALLSGDYKAALAELVPLARQGYAMAQSNLGSMYKDGQGVSKDNKRAMKWHTLAAKQGYAFSQYNLGFMYLHGEGVLADTTRAYMWYSISAHGGDDRGAEAEADLAKSMSPSEIHKAKDMALACLFSNFEDC